MIRFVEENVPAGQPGAPAWRAVIRHVQSREEERFTRIDELLAFINRYVELGSTESGDDASQTDVS